ncbi:MAG: hypothetical protein ACREQI_13225 [Candidatus Binataceae bacterium]
MTFHLLLAVLIGLLAYLAYRFLRGTTEMAGPAQIGAGAAASAVNAGRPAVHVIAIRAQARKDPATNTVIPISTVGIRLRNAGKSPAEITEIYAITGIFDWWRDGKEPRWRALDLGPKRDIPSPTMAIGEPGECEIPIAVDWTADGREAVDGGTKRLGIYGMVTYRGGADGIEYHTRFFWWYSPKIETRMARATSPELTERT